MTGAVAAAGGGGGGLPVVNLNDQQVTDSGVGVLARASYTLKTTGQARHDELALGTGGDYANEWTSPVTDGFGADFEARATTTSGTPGTGTTGTWLALSSDRVWSRSRNAGTPGTTEWIITVEIRRTSDQVVVDSASIDLTASVT